MNKAQILEFIAPFVDEALNKTCIHCGEMEELCNCEEFENIKGKKVMKNDTETKI